MSSGEENRGIDMLERFYNKRDLAGKLGERDEGEGEIELSLGLSLNGRFGVDPKRCNNNSITRAASISGLAVGSGEEDAKRWSLGGGQEMMGLSRTCSLPMDTEEWRKRKELQCLKRLEAKRKRMEKMKNVRMVRVKGGGDEIAVGPPAPQPPPVVVATGKRSSLQFSSQGSIGSQGSGAGSSGVSDPDTHEMPEATNKYLEDGSPASARSSVEQRIDNKPAETVTEKPSPRLEHAGSSDKEALKSMIGNMPCVSTRDGPDGKRINGFLYRCKSGEEVKIMCVCHGDFLSPAEFVKHGGGGDVEHPLRHIVINPSQS